MTNDEARRNDETPTSKRNIHIFFVIWTFVIVSTFELRASSLLCVLFPRAHEQHWHLRPVSHFVDRAPEEQIAKKAMPVRGHRD